MKTLVIDSSDCFHPADKLHLFDYLPRTHTALWRKLTTGSGDKLTDKEISLELVKFIVDEGYEIVYIRESFMYLFMWEFSGQMQRYLEIYKDVKNYDITIIFPDDTSVEYKSQRYKAFDVYYINAEGKEDTALYHQASEEDVRKGLLKEGIQEIISVEEI